MINQQINIFLDTYPYTPSKRGIFGIYLLIYQVVKAYFVLETLNNFIFFIRLCVI